MRAILGLMLAVSLASSASAQVDAGVNLHPFGEPVPQKGPIVPERVTDSLRSNYLESLRLLKLRADRRAQKDGGELTPKHLAMLQRELNALNRAYGINQPARRSTF